MGGQLYKKTYSASTELNWIQRIKTELYITTFTGGWVAQDMWCEGCARYVVFGLSQTGNKAISASIELNWLWIGKIDFFSVGNHPFVQIFQWSILSYLLQSDVVFPLMACPLHPIRYNSRKL